MPKFSRFDPRNKKNKRKKIQYLTKPDTKIKQDEKEHQKEVKYRSWSKSFLEHYTDS